MKAIILGVITALAVTSAAFAQDANGNATKSKRGDALRWCGQMWKAEKAANPDKKGMAAWTEFRKAKCGKGAYAESLKAK